MSINTKEAQASLCRLAGDNYKGALISLDSFYSSAIINLKYCRSLMFSKDQYDMKIVLRSLKEDLKKKVKAVREIVSANDINIDFRNYLHDSVLQNFATVILGISICEKMLTPTTEFERKKLSYLETMIRENRLDFRHKFYSVHINHVPLEELMIPSLSDRLNLIQEVFGLRVDQKIIGDCKNIPIAVLKNVYQISKEGLSNIIKHSKASEIHFFMELSPEKVRLKLKDNGVGFNVKKKLENNGGHLGLPGILYRSDAIQAKTEIKSLPDNGSEISFAWFNNKKQ